MSYGHFSEDNPLSHEIEQALRSELRDGERMIWMGQPDAGQFSRKSWLIVLLAIPFTLIPLVVASGFILFLGPLALVLFIPFLLFGGAISSIPYWLKRAAKRSGYAITNRRAIVRQGTLFGIDVRSYTPDQLRSMRRVERNNGYGDLILEDNLRIGRDSDGDLRRNITQHGFMSIAKVREVEEILRKSLLPDE